MAVEIVVGDIQRPSDRIDDLVIWIGWDEFL